VYVMFQQVILRICTTAIAFTTLRETQHHQARKLIRKLMGQCLLVVSSAITENLDSDAHIKLYR